MAKGRGVFRVLVGIPDHVEDGAWTGLIWLMVGAGGVLL